MNLTSSQTAVVFICFSFVLASLLQDICPNFAVYGKFKWEFKPAPVLCLIVYLVVFFGVRVRRLFGDYEKVVKEKWPS